MVTIPHCPEIVQGVEFQIGRTSIPDRPILIAINNVEANLTTREAADLAYVGTKIKALLSKAAKSGGMPDARRLAGSELAGAEFAIGISVRGKCPVSTCRFPGARFISLARISTISALCLHRLTLRSVSIAAHNPAAARSSWQSALIGVLAGIRGGNLRA